MAEKMCNTINQNIEPYSGKLINRYFKQFGTLLNSRDSRTSDRNDLSHISIPNQIMSNDDSNISIEDPYSDPDTEFHEIKEEEYMHENLRSVWDRGKFSNDTSTPEDMRCLRRLESSVTNLESYFESLPNQDSITSRNTKSVTIICPSPPLDDTLSDVDLDKFDTSKRPSRENYLESISSAIADRAETASLSDFHNVRDVLLNIRERLESYLKDSQEVNDSESANTVNLEGNIADLKKELERYVHIINEKKENELRKFSENMINQSRIMQMKKAFSRKEKLRTNIYETLSSSNEKYAIANNASLAPTMRFLADRENITDGFTMRNCYDNDHIFDTQSEYSSVEYYTMLINEEKGERLLNDAPLPRYNERDKISLIFRDSTNVIEQWQNYQLRTIQIKPKKAKSLKLKWSKGRKYKTPHDVWGFTLDYHQNRALQVKLEKERRLRLICRLFFYFFSVVCFVLIVFIVQSLFTLNRGGTVS